MNHLVHGQQVQIVERLAGEIGAEEALQARRHFGNVDAGVAGGHLDAQQNLVALGGPGRAQGADLEIDAGGAQLGIEGLEPLQMAFQPRQGAGRQRRARPHAVPVGRIGADGVQIGVRRIALGLHEGRQPRRARVDVEALELSLLRLGRVRRPHGVIGGPEAGDVAVFQLNRRGLRQGAGAHEAETQTQSQTDRQSPPTHDGSPQSQARQKGAPRRGVK
ncbi:hypothetical protein D3C72_1268340 [compost metagenome]